MKSETILKIGLMGAAALSMSACDLLFFKQPEPPQINTVPAPVVAPAPVRVAPSSSVVASQSAAAPAPVLSQEEIARQRRQAAAAETRANNSAETPANSSSEPPADNPTAPPREERPPTGWTPG